MTDMDMPLPEPVRILRVEMYVGMGITLYLLTDFTQRTMSPREAEKMGWWKHDAHQSPLAAAVLEEREKIAKALLSLESQDIVARIRLLAAAIRSAAQSQCSASPPARPANSPEP